MEQKVATFYRFAKFPDHASWKPKLEELGEKEKITGTLILAEEGINATLSGPEDGLDRFIDFLGTDPRFANLPIRSMTTPRPTFYRLRILIRPEIVTLGDPSILPSNGSGKYVEPEDWNELINDPDVDVIDVRNDYEVQMGTFTGAVNPETQTFGQWADFVEKRWGQERKKKVAMFCTGGIRCEKASAHLVQNGFEEVYHLGAVFSTIWKGSPSTESVGRGMFCFDHRVSVVHGLIDGKTRLCFSCRWPCRGGLPVPRLRRGVSCPRCAPKLTPPGGKDYAKDKSR